MFFPHIHYLCLQPVARSTPDLLATKKVCSGYSHGGEAGRHTHSGAISGFIHALDYTWRVGGQRKVIKGKGKIPLVLNLETKHINVKQ